MAANTGSRSPGELLVKIKRDLENQVRGLLKNLGLVIGRAKFNVFAVRAEGLIANRPELVAAVRPQSV
jgi:transposase